MKDKIILWTSVVLLASAMLILFFLPKDNFQYEGDAAGIGEISISDWPVFRGNNALTGVSNSDLPDTPLLLWKFKTAAEVKSSPVITGMQVFAASADHKVYCLDLRTGENIWEFTLAARTECPPLCYGGCIYLGDEDGNFYAIDAEAGTPRWQSKVDGKITGSANFAEIPGTKNAYIVFGAYDSMLHCLEAATGKEFWRFKTGSFINGTPAVYGGNAVFGGCDSDIRVLSVADGKEVGLVKAGSYLPSSPAVKAGSIFAGQFENRLLRVDINGMKIAWSYSPQDGGAFFSSPATDGKVVAVGARDGRLHCVRAEDGSPLWTFKARGNVDSSPVICGKKLVCGSDDGRLYIIDLVSGSMLWSYEVGAPIASSPAVSMGIVVVGSDDGCVYAFGEKR